MREGPCTLCMTSAGEGWAVRATLAVKLEAWGAAEGESSMGKEEGLIEG